jgi:hypothetical protein
MKKLLIVLAVLALAVSLPAQPSGVAGVVLNADNQRPIQFARVTIMPRGGMALTDSTGHYLLPLPPGSYQVMAGAEGFEPAVFPETVVVTQGRVTEHIDFALHHMAPPPPPPFGGILGLVFNADNHQPLERALVTASNEGFTRSAWQGPGRGYLIDSLPAGKYWVSATADGFEPGHFRDSVVVVNGRVAEHVDFPLRPTGGPQTGGISGTVISAENQRPITRAVVACGERAYAYTDSIGNYQIAHLLPGKYAVNARAWGFDPAVYPDSVVVTAGNVTPGISFALQPETPHAGAIAGQVTDSDRHIIIRAVVMASSGNNHRCVLQGENGYLLGNLPPGNYWVAAMARGFQPGNHPDSVAVVVGQVTPDINFSLERATPPQRSGISGTVTDAATNQPIPYALILARGPGEGHANTNPQGEYQMVPLQPGRYAAQAVARGYQPSEPESVDVVAGQITPNVNFALQPIPPGTGAISGTVKDSTRNGIFGACVMVRGRNGEGHTTTDSSGDYQIQQLNAGSYVVRAFARGYYPATYPETVAVAEGQTVPDINFVLRHVGPLNAGFGGFVYDGVSQTELAGARVTAVGYAGSSEAQADANGNYVFDDLTSGDYVILAEADGYTSETYLDPVTVEQANINAFTSPAVYPLSGLQETPTKPSARLAVAPNPITTHATVTYALPVAGKFSLKLYDVSGKLVSTLASGYVNAGAGTIHIDAAKFACGIYLLQLETDAAHATRKIVIR